MGVGQLNGIVERITAYIEENDQLDSPVVSFSEDGSSGELLTVFAKACSDNWKDYLQLKQDLSAESKTVSAIVNNLKHSISIAYDTPSHKRQHVPSIIRDVVESDKQLKLGPCRLSALSDYSLDFTFFIESTYDDTGAFFDAIARIKEGLLQAFEANEIEIPLPTSIEIHNQSQCSLRRGVESTAARWLEASCQASEKVMKTISVIGSDSLDLIPGMNQEISPPPPKSHQHAP